MRINVTGNAGSGKSTWAQHIASTLNIPLLGIDSILWKPGWQKASPEELKARLTPLLEEKSWVIDGVSQHVRDKADYIIFLDVPRRICAWRCIKRNAPYLFHSRPGLPPGCPEWRIAPTLAKIIKDFPKNTRPAIMANIAQLKDAGIIIKNPTDQNAINNCIRSIQVIQSE